MDKIESVIEKEFGDTLKTTEKNLKRQQQIDVQCFVFLQNNLKKTDTTFEK